MCERVEHSFVSVQGSHSQSDEMEGGAMADQVLLPARTDSGASVAAKESPSREQIFN